MRKILHHLNGVAGVIMLFMFITTNDFAYISLALLNFYSCYITRGILEDNKQVSE